MSRPKPGGVLTFLALLSVTAAAQTSVSSGSLHGTVTDPSGAAVPAAGIAARNNGTGWLRSTVAEGAGEYRLLQLPPGEYSVQVEKDGFQAKVLTRVRVTVGQAVELNVQLEIGPIRERVEVVAETPLMESERGHQSSTLQAEWIQNLPINRRDYLTYSLLAPSVTDATVLVDNSDFRLKQTPIGAKRLGQRGTFGADPAEIRWMMRIGLDAHLSVGRDLG